MHQVSVHHNNHIFHLLNLNLQVSTLHISHICHSPTLMLQAPTPCNNHTCHFLNLMLMVCTLHNSHTWHFLTKFQPPKTLKPQLICTSHFLNLPLKVQFCIQHILHMSSLHSKMPLKTIKDIITSIEKLDVLIMYSGMLNPRY